MRNLVRPVLALPLLVLAACSSGGGESAEVAGPECEPVDQAILDTIESGAQDGTGLALGKGVAYRSPDHENVYLVAAEFTATGIDGQAGVWATNSIDPSTPGITMAVDGMAQEFTVWPAAESTDAAISPADPSVSAALGCL